MLKAISGYWRFYYFRTLVRYQYISKENLINIIIPLYILYDYYPTHLQICAIDNSISSHQTSSIFWLKINLAMRTIAAIFVLAEILLPLPVDRSFSTHFFRWPRRSLRRNFLSQNLNKPGKEFCKLDGFEKSGGFERELCYHR